MQRCNNSHILYSNDVTPSAANLSISPLRDPEVKHATLICAAGPDIGLLGLIFVLSKPTHRTFTVVGLQLIRAL